MAVFLEVGGERGRQIPRRANQGRKSKDKGSEQVSGRGGGR